MATLATALDKLFETQNHRAGGAVPREASMPVRPFANEDIFFHVKRIDNSRVVTEFGIQFRPYRERVLQIINEVRAEEGLPPISDR